MRELIHSYFLLLAPLSIPIQIALCIHVYKTGRPFWWLWIIFMAPIIGSLAYVVLEILPGMRNTGRHSLNASWFIPRSVLIKRQREELEEGETIKRRLNLASLLYDAGEKTEAETVAAEAASGVFKGDPAVVSEVAWYKIENGKFDDAQRLLDGMDAKPDKLTRTYVELLRARIAYGRTDFAGALSRLEGIQDNSTGEERRYYIALCHLGLGDRPRAVALLEDITKSYRKGSALWRRVEKKWYQAAKDRLKAEKEREARSTSSG